MKMAQSLGINRVVVAMSVARLGDAMGNSILFIVLPLYVAKLPAPVFSLPGTVRVGILISFFGVVNGVLQPVMGALSDRMARRKPMILAGLAVMAAATSLFAFAGSFWHLLLLRCAQGVGVALTIPAVMALMFSSTAPETRGSAMGVYTSMRMIGFAGGPLIGGLLLDWLGFDAAFFAGSASIAVGFVLVELLVRETPVVRTHDGHPFRAFDRRLLSGAILGLGLATLVMAAAFSMMSTLEEQFNERLNQSAFAFSVAFSMVMVTRLLLQIPLGRLSDRIGRKPPIILGLVLMAPSTALLGWAGSTLELVLLRLVQGVAAAAIAAPTFALAGDLSRSGGEARQMSFVTAGFSLGIAVGPLLAGVLAVVSFHLPFAIGGILSLVAAAIVYRLVPETVTRRRDAE